MFRLNKYKRSFIEKIVTLVIVGIFLFTQFSWAALFEKSATTRIVRRGAEEFATPPLPVLPEATPPLPVLPEATETGFVEIPDGGMGEYGDMIVNFRESFFNPSDPGYNFDWSTGLPASLTIDGLGNFQINYDGDIYTMIGDSGGVTVTNWEDGARITMEQDGVTQILTFDQSDETFAFNSTDGNTVINFNVTDTTGELYMASQGREVRIIGYEVTGNGDISATIEMRGPTMDVTISHTALPEGFDGRQFINSLTDFDGEIEIEGGSVAVDYDEGSEQATVSIRGPGGDTIATATAQAKPYWTKGRVFLTICKAITLLSAVPVAASFFNAGAVETALASAGLAALQGHYLYRIYYRLTRAGLTGYLSATVDYEKIEIIPDNTVMTEGLQEPVIVGYSIAAFDIEKLAILREGIAQTIDWFPDGKTNNNLHIAIVSDTFPVTGNIFNQLLELRYWKELREEFEGKAVINYFIRTPEGNIGFKPIAVFDAGNYALTGGTSGAGVTHAERDLGRRIRDQWTIDASGNIEKIQIRGRPRGTRIFGGPEFIARLAQGDPVAIETALEKGLLTQEQIDELGIEDNPILTSDEAAEFKSGIMGDVPQTPHFITMDPGDTIGEEGQNPEEAFLLWAAQVTTALKEGLGYEAFTPKLTIANPDESVLTRFQNRASLAFEPIARTLNSIFETQTPYGNTWFLMDIYKQKVMGMDVDGSIIADPILNVDTDTSHDQIEGMTLRVRQFLNVRVPNAIFATFSAIKGGFQRWIYGDTLAHDREVGYNHPVGRFINKLTGARKIGLGPFTIGGLGPVTPELEHRASNPVDFLMASLDFAKFLTLMSVTSRIPALLYPANPALAGAITIAIVGGLYMGGTLIVAPLVEAIKTGGLQPIREALRNRNYEDASNQLWEFIYGSVEEARPGPGMALHTAVQAHLFLMPFLVLQPMMYYTAQIYRAREWAADRTTKWVKKPFNPFEWKKIPMEQMADYAVSLLGLAFTFNLFDTMGISLMSVLGTATIGLPLMLWALYTSRK